LACSAAAAAAAAMHAPQQLRCCSSLLLCIARLLQATGELRFTFWFCCNSSDKVKP